jgi:uncharacterized protein YegJ (DUF2314 family)
LRALRARIIIKPPLAADPGVRRTRSHVMAKRLLGGVALLMGITVLGWFGYNMIRPPTQEFTGSFRSVFQLIVPAAMVWYGWRWLMDAGPGIETIQIDPNAPELAESVQQAKQTMPAFLQAVRRHQDGAYIKFPIVTDAGATEHIWAYVHHYADGVFNVSLANTPYTQKGAIETRRDVSESEVEDWQIMKSDGRIKGGYSLRALFKHVERKGIHLNRTMRKQRAQFLDAAEQRDEADEARAG